VRLRLTLPSWCHLLSQATPGKGPARPELGKDFVDFPFFANGSSKNAKMVPW